MKNQTESLYHYINYHNSNAYEASFYFRRNETIQKDDQHYQTDSIHLSNNQEEW